MGTIFKAKDKIFDKDENKKAWKHLMMYVFQTGKTIEEVAGELRTEEYFLMKFIDKHMDISMALVERIMTLPVKVNHCNSK